MIQYICVFLLEGKKKLIDMKHHKRKIKRISAFLATFLTISCNSLAMNLQPNGIAQHYARVSSREMVSVINDYGAHKEFTRYVCQKYKMISCNIADILDANAFVCALLDGCRGNEIKKYMECYKAAYRVEKNLMKSRAKAMYYFKFNPNININEYCTKYMYIYQKKMLEGKDQIESGIYANMLISGYKEEFIERYIKTYIMKLNETGNPFEAMLYSLFYNLNYGEYFSKLHSKNFKTFEKFTKGTKYKLHLINWLHIENDMDRAVEYANLCESRERAGFVGADVECYAYWMMIGNRKKVDDYIEIVRGNIRKYPGNPYSYLLIREYAYWMVNFKEKEDAEVYVSIIEEKLREFNDDVKAVQYARCAMLGKTDEESRSYLKEYANIRRSSERNETALKTLSILSRGPIVQLTQKGQAAELLCNKGEKYLKLFRTELEINEETYKAEARAELSRSMSKKLLDEFTEIYASRIKLGYDILDAALYAYWVSANNDYKLAEKYIDEYKKQISLEKSVYEAWKIAYCTAYELEEELKDNGDIYYREQFRIMSLANRLVNNVEVNRTQLDIREFFDSINDDKIHEVYFEKIEEGYKKEDAKEFVKIYLDQLRLQNNDHEIAYAYAFLIFNRLNPEEFKEHVRRYKEILRSSSGHSIIAKRYLYGLLENVDQPIDKKRIKMKKEGI